MFKCILVMIFGKLDKFLKQILCTLLPAVSYSITFVLLHYLTYKGIAFALQYNELRVLSLQFLCKTLKLC